jgi:hypothetical protein
MVSQPEPVASTYATLVGERMLSVDDGIPLGEMLTCRLVRGADAVKKTGCRIAHAARSSEMEE